MHKFRCSLEGRCLAIFEKKLPFKASQVVLCDRTCAQWCYGALGRHMAPAQSDLPRGSFPIACLPHLDVVQKNKTKRLGGCPKGLEWVHCTANLPSSNPSWPLQPYCYPGTPSALRDLFVASLCPTRHTHTSQMLYVNTSVELPALPQCLALSSIKTFVKALAFQALAPFFWLYLAPLAWVHSAGPWLLGANLCLALLRLWAPGPGLKIFGFWAWPSQPQPTSVALPASGFDPLAFHLPVPCAPVPARAQDLTCLQVPLWPIFLPYQPHLILSCLIRTQRQAATLD